MIEAVNKSLVLIKPDEVTETTEGGLVKTPQVIANEKAKVNRGIVLKVGSDVTWPSEGDYVGFYKGAANSIEDDGNEVLLIEARNILVKLKTI